MGFSLFKKKNKDKTPAASPNLSVPTNNRPMASPNLRNPNTPSSSGSPRVFGTPMMNSPALSVNEWGHVPSIATGRRIKLRCVLDPLPNANGNFQEDVNSKGEALKELFYITTELDAPIETLRHQIEQELAVEGKFSVGIFKVAIPWAAHYQAKTYANRYALPVHLISHFSSFFLDDPSQLNASYSVQAATQHLVKPDAAADSHLFETTVEDWWPEGVDNKDGAISVLIRLGEPVTTGLPPLTLMVHFAEYPMSTMVSFPPSPVSLDFAGAAVEQDAPNPPLAIEVSREATVSDLKEAVLRADGRPVGLLEKIKLWKVDLTWKEIMECDAAGDGKEGSMPWPYAPNAPETTPLQDSTVSLDAIFPEYKPNANRISIFVWIHPSALGILTRSKDLTLPILGEGIPNFQYPMKIRRHASKVERQAMLEKNKVRSIANYQEDADGNMLRRPSLGRIGRPVTAPSSAASSPGGSPVLPTVSYGGRKGILKRSSSGLSHAHMLPSSSPGLNFAGVPRISLYRSPNGSVSSSNVTSPFSSDSEDSSGFTSVPQTPLTSALDLRVDFLTMPMLAPAKTVRWSQDMDIPRKKVTASRTVTIVEGEEVDTDDSEVPHAI